jgi:hypothetical protein
MKLPPGFEKRVVAAAAKWVPLWFRTSRASSQDSLPWLSSRRLFSRDDRKCPGLPTRRRVHLQSPPPACACVRAPGPPSPHDPRTIAARNNENLYSSQSSCRQLTRIVNGTTRKTMNKNEPICQQMENKSENTDPERNTADQHQVGPILIAIKTRDNSTLRPSRRRKSTGREGLQHKLLPRIRRELRRN